MVARYQKRVSGPLLDRFDIFVEVPRVEYEKLVEDSTAETSEVVRHRVEAARKVQQQRFKELGLTGNADMGPQEVWRFCALEDSSKGLLKAAMERLALSARAFHRVLKLSCTIADLAGVETMGVAHLAEALQYRPRS